MSTSRAWATARRSALIFTAFAAIACAGQSPSATQPAAQNEAATHAGATEGHGDSGPHSTTEHHDGMDHHNGTHHHDGMDHHHGSGPLVHRFEHAEDWAREFDDPARDAWQKPVDVVASMRIQEGMVVADIGAGTGYFEPYLSRAVGAGGAVLALDVEPDMVRYMNERFAREGLKNVRPSVVPGDDPKLAPGSVDRILIVDTWHHIPEREAYAGKLRDALKSGGKVFIVDFKIDAKHGPPPEHRLKPEGVARELEAGGLRAEILGTSLPEQYIVTGAKP